MPGYLVAVVVILTLLPDAKADLTVWLANLSLTQIYVPLTLTAGLTQMWGAWPGIEPSGRGLDPPRARSGLPRRRRPPPGARHRAHRRG